MNKELEIKAKEEKIRLEKIKQKQNLDKKIKVHLPKVKVRQFRAEHQKLSLQEAGYFKKFEVEDRQARLDYLIENYRSRPQVGFSFNRLISDTQAVQNRMDATEAQPLFSNPGYTDSKLMGSVSFKLQTALYEAGLHNTDYGR